MLWLLWFLYRRKVLSRKHWRRSLVLTILLLLLAYGHGTNDTGKLILTGAKMIYKGAYYIRACKHNKHALLSRSMDENWELV